MYPQQRSAVLTVTAYPVSQLPIVIVPKQTSGVNDNINSVYQG